MYLYSFNSICQKEPRSKITQPEAVINLPWQSDRHRVLCFIPLLCHYQRPCPKWPRQRSTWIKAYLESEGAIASMFVTAVVVMVPDAHKISLAFSKEGKCMIPFKFSFLWFPFCLQWSLLQEIISSMDETSASLMLIFTPLRAEPLAFSLVVWCLWD